MTREFLNIVNYLLLLWPVFVPGISARHVGKVVWVIGGEKQRCLQCSFNMRRVTRGATRRPSGL